MKRAIALCLALFPLTAQAKPIPPCWIIMPYVWAYGEQAATDWAKAKGYTPDEIAEARRRCGKDRRRP
jgi:hypothetical protein